MKKLVEKLNYGFAILSLTLFSLMMLWVIWDSIDMALNANRGRVNHLIHMLKELVK